MVLSIWQTSRRRTSDAPFDAFEEPCVVTVSALFVHPVKSMRGIACAQVRLSATGLDWDRQWMVVDANPAAMPLAIMLKSGCPCWH